MGGIKLKKIINTSFIILSIIYLLALIYILFGRKINYWQDLSTIEYIKYSSNIIPFKTISKYIKYIFNGNIYIEISIKNLLGNFILFLPTGIFLPYFIKNVITSYSIHYTKLYED